MCNLQRFPYCILSIVAAMTGSLMITWYVRLKSQVLIWQFASTRSTIMPAADGEILMQELASRPTPISIYRLVDISTKRTKYLLSDNRLAQALCYNILNIGFLLKIWMDASWLEIVLCIKLTTCRLYACIRVDEPCISEQEHKKKSMSYYTRHVVIVIFFFLYVYNLSARQLIDSKFVCRVLDTFFPYTSTLEVAKTFAYSADRSWSSYFDRETIYNV